MLPSFIGIGAPRSGSTWLHELLRAHPNVYLPRQRKELNFFNQNDSRGIDWYEKYFPPDHASNRSRAVADFLGVDPARIPRDAGKTAVNKSMIARHAALFEASHRISQKLRDTDQDWLVSSGAARRLKRWLVGEPSSLPPMASADRAWLADHYWGEFDRIER